MKKIIINIISAFSLALLAVSHIFSQENSSKLSESNKLFIVKKAIALLHENYVFPEKVDKIETVIMKKFKNKEYENFKNPEDFLNTLSRDMQNEAQDKHIKISFGPDRVKQIMKEKENEGKAPVITQEWLQRMQYENFRLRKVEWLEGNIGYFRFLNFTDLEPSKESIISAMNFIRNSYAIIIDLRDNGGGSSETLQFILSYFLKDGLKIGEFHFRKGNRIEENIIKKDPAVNKIPDDVPLYILVSKRTASAAEGMASVLQGFGRAIIVGENTKGEGNPGELFVVNDQLYIMIPTAESKSAVPNAKPVEGIGVIPDIFIDPSKSFEKAMLEICKTLADRIPVKQLKQGYNWQIPMWEYNLNPPNIPVDLKEKIMGEYKDGRKLIFENGSFFYLSSGSQKIRLFYYGDNIFGMDGKQFTRIRIPESEGQINYFDFIWDDGVVETIPRIK